MPMLSALVAVVLAAASQDADAGQIEKWIASLDSEEAKVREDAEAHLLQSGRRIRSLLAAALPRLSPEQKGRVEAVLQRFVIEDEEDFALRLLKRGDPFPLPPPKPGAQGETVALQTGTPLPEAISMLARRANLSVEFYAPDSAFR